LAIPLQCKHDKLNMNNNRALPTISLISAFFLGVILFWSFGKNSLNLESLPVFLVGLVGVAIPVLIFGVWNIVRHSHDNQNR
jgi:predicted membrane protein